MFSPFLPFIHSKEDQVEELLARADNLVTEQQEPDVLVYEAMAESLGSAWKELNRQLQMRGYLLKEALRFYEYAEQHERGTNLKSGQHWHYKFNFSFSFSFNRGIRISLDFIRTAGRIILVFGQLSHLQAKSAHFDKLIEVSLLKLLLSLQAFYSSGDVAEFRRFCISGGAAQDL
ncbi:unnamed protein product [Toxocara canis]|uniref:DOCKER domain-containing protein n=1 Tax=Toxocara canis TaxID=6265 RepID=A0A183U711_TOXCA|nr:unnamed protein product [Toxocara canis]